MKRDSALKRELREPSRATKRRIKLEKFGDSLFLLLLARLGFLLGALPAAPELTQHVDQELALLFELRLLALLALGAMVLLRVSASKWLLPQVPLGRWLLGYLMFFLGMQLSSSAGLGFGLSFLLLGYMVSHVEPELPALLPPPSPPLKLSLPEELSEPLDEPQEQEQELFSTDQESLIDEVEYEDEALPPENPQEAQDPEQSSASQ